MKKLLIVLMLLAPALGFAQIKNDERLAVCFTDLLNAYRKENGLQPVALDTSLREFSMSRTQFLKRTNMAWHGKGTPDDFQIVGRKFRIDNGWGYIGENCLKVHNFAREQTPDVITLFDKYLAFDPIVDGYQTKGRKYGFTECDWAAIFLREWQISPSHNDFLLSKDITIIYLTQALNKVGTQIVVQMTGAGPKYSGAYKTIK